MDSPIVTDFESDDPQSEVGWCAAWETDTPGAGTGAESVYRLDSKYYYWSSSEEDFGPFDSLQKTLLSNIELLQVFPTSVSVDCPELSAEEIAEMLVPDELDYGHKLAINDEIWIFCEPGVFRMR